MARTKREPAARSKLEPAARGKDVTARGKPEAVAASAGASAGADAGADAGASVPTTACGRLSAALFSSVSSAYFWACVVYLLYTCQALAVDFCSVTSPDVTTHYPATNVTNATTDDPYAYVYTPAYDYTAPSEKCNETGLTSINKQYLGLAAVHLFNSLQFAFAWRAWFAANGADTSLAFRAALLVPEALNVIEAAIYVRSAALYAPYSLISACVNGYVCDEYAYLHRLELAAATIELAAAICWCWSWWVTHERKPGRGLSLWDVDLYSQILLLVPSAMYVAYNVDISTNPGSYGTNVLFKKGDVVYFVGAVLYLVGALRDNGAFWFVPVPCAAAGRAGGGKGLASDSPPRRVAPVRPPADEGGSASPSGVGAGVEPEKGAATADAAAAAEGGDVAVKAPAGAAGALPPGAPSLPARIDNAYGDARKHSRAALVVTGSSRTAAADAVLGGGAGRRG